MTTTGIAERRSAVPEQKQDDSTQATGHDMWCICDECVEVVMEEIIEDRARIES